MAIEFFVIPMIGTGVDGDTFRAKYVYDNGLKHSTVKYSKQDDAIVAVDANQGQLNQLANQSDVSRICTLDELDDQLTAQQITNVSAALEAREIPAGWLSVGDTWRDVIRTVCHIFFLNQRLEGIAYRPFHDNIRTWLQNGNLANIAGSFDLVTGYTPSDPEDPESPDVPITTTYTYVEAATWGLGRQAKVLLNYVTYSQLPAGPQQFLQDVIDRQGWTAQELGLTGASTVKEILRAMGAQGVGIRRRLARHGLTLDSDWSQLPDNWKNELREIVEDFGLDPVALGLSGTSTVRQILKTFAEQFDGLSIDFTGVTV